MRYNLYTIVLYILYKYIHMYGTVYMLTAF